MPQALRKPPGRSPDSRVSGWSPPDAPPSQAFQGPVAAAGGTPGGGRVCSLTVAGAVQALRDAGGVARTCFPFHPSRADRASDTRAVNRLPRDYIPRAGRGISPDRNVIEHFQKRPLFLDAPMVLKDSAAVEAEFSALEAKVSQFVNVCERLRAENSDLRQQLAAAQNDAKRLSDKMDGARSKLETLISRLPD